MTTPDQPIPLASVAQFETTAFSDLAVNLQDGELSDIMNQATRACESVCKRRLAPFTTTESQRVEGIDPDEYGSSSTSMPLDLPGTVGRSYANALGAGDLVRHMWLANYAPQYPEMWENYTVTALTILRSFGGSQPVQIGSILGPEPDTGHIWFPIGTFLPVGSMVRVTYSGGYTTVPADLAAASMSMAASIIIKRLDPNIGSAHDPDLLRNEAVELLDPYMRD